MELAPNKWVPGDRIQVVWVGSECLGYNKPSRWPRVTHFLNTLYSFTIGGT